MSRIEVAVGSASVDLQSVVDRESAFGTYPCYMPRDLMDATAAALLAVNTPDAIKYAHALFHLTKDAA